MMTTCKGKRLFAFLGENLSLYHSGLLSQLATDGILPLALDVPAIGMCEEAGLAYTTLSDWLDREQVMAIFRHAQICEHNWFRDAEGLFTVEGICWPAIDHLAMHWFWLAVFTAASLTDRFAAEGVKEILLPDQPVPRPALYYYPTDVWKRTLCASMPGMVKTLPLLWPACRFDSRLLRHLSRVLRAKALARVRLAIDSACKYILQGRTVPVVDNFKGKLAIAINPGELFRFSRFLNVLETTYPGRTVAITLDQTQIPLQKTLELTRTPVISGPKQLPVNLDHERRFLEAFQSVVNASTDLPWGAHLEANRFHFDCFCRNRWPTLAAQYGSWLRYWQNLEPRTVFVSCLLDAESQLPAEAARASGIPVYSLPHSILNSRHSTREPASIGLYCFELQRMMYRERSYPESRLQACRDVFIENQYPCSDPDPTWTRETADLLFLTNPIGRPGIILPNVLPHLHREVILSLLEPPADIKTRIQIRLRTHPEISDLELFSAATRKRFEPILSNKGTLSVCLERASLVIAINCSGSALVHALRSGKPVVLFQTIPFFGSPSRELLQKAAYNVVSVEEMWDAVRRFLDDPDWAAAVGQRAMEFVEDFLQLSDYPGIGKVLTPLQMSLALFS